MSTELFASKISRRAHNAPRYRLHADVHALRRQAASMLQAFAERLLTDLAEQGVMLPPAIEFWLDSHQQFHVRDNHPDAQDILHTLETPSYYLHFKSLEVAYELLQRARAGVLADSSHLHIGLTSGGPVAFLCERHPDSATHLNAAAHDSRPFGRAAPG